MPLHLTEEDLRAIYRVFDNHTNYVSNTTNTATGYTTMTCPNVEEKYADLPVAQPYWTSDIWKEYLKEEDRFMSEEVEACFEQARHNPRTRSHHAFVHAYKELLYVEGI